MIGVDQAVTEMLETVSRNIERLDKIRETGGPLGIAAMCMRSDLVLSADNLRVAVGNIDEPDHVCPLCAQPKQQVDRVGRSEA